MAVVHIHHTRKRILSDCIWHHRWSRKPAPTSIWGPYGLLGTQQTTGASALCPVATLSLFVTVDDCICRHGFGVFLVQAATIMLAGCNHDALGPKRARRGRVVKGRKDLMDFHDLNGDRSPKIASVHYQGSGGWCATYKQDLCILRCKDLNSAGARGIWCLGGRLTKL